MRHRQILPTSSIFVAFLAGCTTTPASEGAIPETNDQASQGSVKPPPPEPTPTIAVPAPEDVAMAPVDATRTDSGLAYKLFEEGTGSKHPGEIDLVTIAYTGWKPDGTMFDTSLRQGKPVEVGVNQVPAGLGEAIQQLVEGAKGRFWIPGELAYGEAGNESIGFPGAPTGMLVFDIELVSFRPGPKPHAVPKNVGAAPANATTSASGLASRVLKKGAGRKHPEQGGTVTVNYTAWTTDGEVIDSTGAAGSPVTVTLDNVMPGLREGVQQMVNGEKRRLWIPGKLAYHNRPGRPQGMIVVDVELIEVHEAKPQVEPGEAGDRRDTAAPQE